MTTAVEVSFAEPFARSHAWLFYFAARGTWPAQVLPPGYQVVALSSNAQKLNETKVVELTVDAAAPIDHALLREWIHGCCGGEAKVTTRPLQESCREAAAQVA